MEKTVRINKALADAGVCSRRRADELIAAGRVSVTGEPVATPGLQVRPGVGGCFPWGVSTFFRKGLSCSPTTAN